jgi:hypothetical protein
MANLKKKTSDLLANLKRIENKQIALRAAIGRSRAWADAIRNAPIIVKRDVQSKTITPKRGGN